jgi:Family of unknown function (DUF6131)
LTLQRGNDHSPLGKFPNAFRRSGEAEGASGMLILGLILLIIGFVAKIAILWTIGIILLIIGAVLWILGSMGRPVGGRRHYW